MLRRRFQLLSFFLVLLSICQGSSAQTTSSNIKNRVFFIGDSTMATRNGYGDAVCEWLNGSAECLNLAKNGRSSKSFRAEGLWDDVLARLNNKPAGLAAYVLVQFGHNDQPGKPGRSTDLQTEFPYNISRYVTELRQAGATPVLVTPLTRRSFKGETLEPDLEPWAQATRAVAQAQGALLVDLYAQSYAAVQPLGQAQADTLAMDAHLAPGLQAAQAAPAKSKFDRTHLGPQGAALFGGMMARALQGLDGMGSLFKAD